MRTSKNELARRVMLAMVLCTSPAAAQLVNGSFDDGGGSLDNWSTFNNSVPNVLADTITPRSGAHAARIFGGFNGNPNFSGLLQNLPAAEGQTLEADAFVRHNSNDRLSGSNRLALKIEFYRVMGGAYGSADMLGEHEVTALDAASPTNAWQAVSLQAVAPADTVEARLALVFVQSNNASGAALVDDVTFAAAGSGGGWTLIWQDEFDGASIDGSKWRVEDIHIVKNNELQYYAPDEVFLQNGNLVLRSRARTYWGFDTNGAWRQFDYTSGLVETRNRFEFTFGRVEIRAKLPGTQGMWPAHWMLPAAGGWPPEIDIMELLGHQPDTVHMSHHWGPLGPNGEPPWEIGQTETGTFTGPDFTQGFHTFAIEWYPDRIIWFVDGIARFTATDTIPQQPFYLILNTAVGGFWPGPPDGSSVFPQRHEFDYVRIYAAVGGGDGLLEVVDDTTTSGVPDGSITAGEYVASTTGINSGLFDIIGETTPFHFDSGGDGRINFAFESVTALPNPGPYGVVIYVDSVAGGFTSTADFTDVADRSRRLASGRGNGGEVGELFFSPGFEADFAIVIEGNRAMVYDLEETSHQLINGADLGAANDVLGGSDVAYFASGDGRTREFEALLAHIGVAQGDAFDFVVTLQHGNSAFRANEFVGVATGNAWDTLNPGTESAVLKFDDFIRFTSSLPGGGCGPACDVTGGDADVDDDCDVDLGDLSALLGNFGAAGATHGQGDTDNDGDIDLTDLSNMLGSFGNDCS